ATLTSSGSPVANKTISFYLLGSATAIGTATTNASGIATLSVSLAGISAGVYPTGVSAQFAGDPAGTTPRYGFSSGVNSLTVTAGFTLSVPSSITYGQTGQATTTGGGTGAVTYSTTGGGCTIDATTGVIMVTDASQQCLISANKAGDGAFAPASAGPMPVTLNKATLTVTADAKTKAYAYGDPAPAWTYKGPATTDTTAAALSGSLTRATGENVGNYAITQGTLAVSGNYNLTYVGANLVITARSL